MTSMANCVIRVFWGVDSENRKAERIQSMVLFASVPPDTKTFGQWFAAVWPKSSIIRWVLKGSRSFVPFFCLFCYLLVK